MSRLSDSQNFQPDSSSHDLANLSFWENTEPAQTECHYCNVKIPQQTLRVKDLPPEERPRDRLARLGAKSLSTGELLSILLSTGQGAGKLSALGLGQYIGCAST